MYIKLSLLFFKSGEIEVHSTIFKNDEAESSSCGSVG